MKLTIDRITETVAVCERDDGAVCRIPREALPQGAREGSILHEENGAFVLSAEETAARRAALRRKLSAILRKRRV